MEWTLTLAQSQVTGWLAVAVIAGVIAGLGVYLDTILHDRHKSKVQEALLEFWARLDRHKVPDLPRLMADWTLNRVEQLFGQRWWHPRAALPAMLVSCSLTFVALRIGSNAADWSEVSVRTVLDSLFLPSPSFDWPILFEAVVYGLNFVFDVLTILFTLHILRLIARTNWVVVSFVWMVADAMLAVLLAIGCQMALLYYLFLTAGVVPTQPPLMPFRNVLLALGITQAGKGSAFLLALYGATTLIPTLLYLGVLLFMFAAKPILRFLHWFARYVLQTSVEGKLAFTPLTATFAFLAVLFKAIHDVTR